MQRSCEEKEGEPGERQGKTHWVLVFIHVHHLAVHSIGISVLHKAFSTVHVLHLMSELRTSRNLWCLAISSNPTELTQLQTLKAQCQQKYWNIWMFTIQRFHSWIPRCFTGLTVWQTLTQLQMVWPPSSISSWRLKAAACGAFSLVQWEEELSG